MKFALFQRNRLRILRDKHFIGQAFHPGTIVLTYGAMTEIGKTGILRIKKANLLNALLFLDGYYVINKI